MYRTTITHFEVDGLKHKTRSDSFWEIEDAIEWGKDYGQELVYQMEEKGFEVEEFQVEVKESNGAKVFSEMVRV